METQPRHTRPISRGKQSMDSTSGSGRMNKLIWSCSYVRSSLFWVSFSSNQRRNSDPDGEVKQIPHGVALVPVQGTRLVAYNDLLNGVFDMVAVGFTSPAVSPRESFMSSILGEIEGDVSYSFEDGLESVLAFQNIPWPAAEDESILGINMTPHLSERQPYEAVACLVGSRLHVSLDDSVDESAKTRVVVGSATRSIEIGSSKSIWLSPGDQYIIMGTPGLWKWLTAEEAVNTVRHCDTPHDASVSIVQAAVDRMKERRSLVLKMKDEIHLGISKLVTSSIDEPTFDHNNPSDITVTVIFTDQKGLKRLRKSRGK